MPLGLLVLSAVLSCTKVTGGSQAELSLSVPKTSVDYTASSQFIRVTANSTWTLSIDFGAGQAWASIDRTSGSGSDSGLVLSWTENASEEKRTCTITLAGEGKLSSATLSQDFEGSPSVDPLPVELKADTPGKWLELPATDDKNLYFFTHEMTLSDGSKSRNYSFYLDPGSKVSVWVAYPLNKTLIGSGSRTDEWSLDPKVPKAYQSVIYSGYKGGYQRGHQMPSADRLARGVNETSFYGTNITPQLGTLNEKAWATLESKIRNWSYQMDTLYVVTGADLKGSTDYAYDNEDKAIPVPSGYFKALLGYKKNGSIGAKTGGFVGIAFYFEHKFYLDSAIMGTQSMSIDALETKLGYDFFVNLPTLAGQAISDKVESSIDSWWQ